MTAPSIFAPLIFPQDAMPQVRHLRHAPIREAVLDVRIPRTGVAPLDALRELAGSLSGFANVDAQFQFESGIQWSGSGEVSRHDRTEPLGFRAVSEDETRVVQFRLDGFSYSRLRPYTSWEEIRDEARPLLERYVETVGSRDGIRLALRYINHLRLPYPTEDLKKFVLGLPDPPEGWPAAVESFLYRITLADDSGASVHVTHALVDDVDESRIGVIFDIDAFREGRFTVGDDAFWRTFEELRDLKNRIFFRGITDRTVEMYA